MRPQNEMVTAGRRDILKRNFAWACLSADYHLFKEVLDTWKDETCAVDTMGRCREGGEDCV